MALVERDEEIAYLAESVARASRREGRCVVVEGAAGLGKSSLLRRAQRVGHEAGLRVLSACGGELEQELPYSIVRQLFDQVLHDGTTAFRTEVFADAAGHAAPVFGYAAAPVNPAAVDHGLYWLVANLAEHGPLMLTVDDAHWSDEASTRFLTYLAYRISDLPVLLVIGTRGAAMFEEAPHSVLRLSPLSEQGVGVVLQDGLDAAVDDEFRRECRHLTGGNPFLLAEIIATLRESGIRPEASAVAELPGMSPDSVARSVLGRVGKIGAAALTIARAVALLGPDAQLPRLAELAGSSASDAQRTVETLCGEGILTVEDDVVGFVHPILRSVVYSDIGAASRSAEHRRIADLLGRDGHPPGSLVPHLLATAAAGDPAMVRILRRAAAEALASAAPEVAVQSLQRALVEPPPTDQLPSLHRQLGSALSNSNRMGEAIDAYRQALATVTDSAERTEIAVEFGWLLMMRGLGEQATQVLQNVAATAPFAHLPTSTQAALTVAGLAAMQPPRTWTERLDTVEELPATGPDRQLFLANLAFAAMACADRPATEVVRIAHSALVEPIAPQIRFMAVSSLCPALTVSDDIPAALDLLNHSVDVARQDGDVGTWRYLMVMRSLISLEVGDLMGAEADARLTLDMERRERSPRVPTAAAMLVKALIDRGNLAEAAQIGRELVVDARPQGIMPHFVLQARGRLRRHQRRYDEALADLLTSGRLLTEHGYDNPGFMFWRTEAALGHLGRGDTAQARRLAHEHVELAREFGAPRGIGVGLWALGLTETRHRRLNLLAEAADVLEHSTATLLRGRVLIDLGAALRRAGRRLRAIEVLQSGLDIAARSHAELLERRAREELTAAGAPARRTAVIGVDALTASELRVATYAADGLTNREIAQTLFVSRRTVELHLTNAFRKLSIEKRDQLAGKLR